jgi:capsular polysaccharide biosynthesis protein
MVKKIIVDFDNTLAIHRTEDTSNISKAEPNIELIEVLNKLYEKYYIKILTARGHISCKNREEAEKTYRPIIESWLKKYNVKYNELSFNKDLAEFYIDDKALRPYEIDVLEEFI